MENIVSFFVELDKKLNLLEDLLKKLLKEEKHLRKDAFVKTGFIIKKYSIKLNVIDLNILKELKEKSINVLRMESILKQEIKKIKKNKYDLEEFIEQYFLKTGKNLDFELLSQYLNNAFYNSKLVIVRIDELTKLIENGLKTHKKLLNKRDLYIISSMEKMTNQVLRLIESIGYVAKDIRKFEIGSPESYYLTARTYGRAMGSRELKITKKENRLSSLKDPTPVFDSPSATRRRIISMSNDQRRNFFGQIGVQDFTKVLFFKTKLKPINHDNPIGQSNGLYEYKFPQGIRIKILKVA